MYEAEGTEEERHGGGQIREAAGLFIPVSLLFSLSFPALLRLSLASLPLMYPFEPLFPRHESNHVHSQRAARISFRGDVITIRLIPLVQGSRAPSANLSRSARANLG